MRLTKKTKNGYFHKLFGDNPIYTREQMLSDLDDIVQKLGQLEDIEEELRIDLITLFKAFNGCCYRDKNGSILWCDKPRLVPSITYVLNFKNPEKSFQYLSGLELVVSKKSYKVQVTDYGKTWALTKEELGIKKS